MVPVAGRPAPSGTRMVPLRRMFPYGTESTAQVDESGTIQVQRGYGGPSGRRASLDEQEIRAPGKMTRPALAARVEQRSGPPRLWIARMGLGVFVAVAEVAIALPLKLTRLDPARHIR